MKLVRKNHSTIYISRSLSACFTRVPLFHSLMLCRSKQGTGGHTLSLCSRLVTNLTGQPRLGQWCRCIVHIVVGGEGGDQRLPARPDRRPCRSLRESAGSGGPPTPSSSLRYCGQDAASRRRLCNIPTTLRYIFLQNLPCSTAPAPHVAVYGYFSTSAGYSIPPRPLLLLEVKLVHIVESKSWFK